MSADMRLSDDWIDDTARALTEGEPAPGFRARVLARIDERVDAKRARRLFLGFAWRPIAVAAAAIAIVVIAVVGSRNGTEHGERRIAADIRLAPEVRLLVPPKLAPERASEGGRPDPTNGPARVVATVTEAPPTVPAPPPIEVASVDTPPFEIAALEELDPMGSGDIQIDSIDVAPLTQ